MIRFSVTKKKLFSRWHLRSLKKTFSTEMKRKMYVIKSVVLIKENAFAVLRKRRTAL